MFDKELAGFVLLGFGFWWWLFCFHLIGTERAADEIQMFIFFLSVVMWHKIRVSRVTGPLAIKDLRD